jgi:hypothetical protein
MECVTEHQFGDQDFPRNRLAYAWPLWGEKKKGVRRICVDFDGVLHSFTSGFTGEIPFDPPTPGAVEFVRWLVEREWEIVIFSARARTEKGQQGILNWWCHFGFSPILSTGYASPIFLTAIKCDADLYLDDRGWRFTGNFEEVISLLVLNDATGGKWLRPWHEQHEKR